MSDATESFVVDSTRDTINQFSYVTSQTAERKGFHQAFEDADWLMSIVERINEFSGSPVLFDPEEADRLEDISSRLRMLEIGTKLMLIVSECGEAFESLRNTGYQGHMEGEGNLGEELADACIRLGDLAGMVGVKLGNDITDKMAVNKDRPYRHGRQA